MAVKTHPLPIVKPIENLEELLLDMGLRLCISVEAFKGSRRWQIQAHRGVGVGDTRESAVAEGWRALGNNPSVCRGQKGVFYG